MTTTTPGPTDVRGEAPAGPGTNPTPPPASHAGHLPPGSVPGEVPTPGHAAAALRGVAASRSPRVPAAPGAGDSLHDPDPVPPRPRPMPCPLPDVQTPAVGMTRHGS